MRSRGAGRLSVFALATVLLTCPLPAAQTQPPVIHARSKVVTIIDGLHEKTLIKKATVPKLTMTFDASITLRNSDGEHVVPQSNHNTIAIAGLVVDNRGQKRVRVW